MAGASLGTWAALALTFLLRDPVARAVSHSHHMRDEGHEPLPTRESALDSDPPALVVSTTPRIGPTEAYAPGAPRHRTAGSP